MSMEAADSISPAGIVTPKGMYVRRKKRPKISAHGNDPTPIFSSAMTNAAEQKKLRTSGSVTDYSSPFSIPELLDGLESAKYGSLTKDIEALMAKKMEILNPYISQNPALSNMFLQVESRVKEARNFMNHQVSPIITSRVKEAQIFLNHQASPVITSVIDLEDNSAPCKEMVAYQKPVIVIDSDDEDCGNKKPPIFQEVVLERASGELVMKGLVDYHASLKDSDDNKDKRKVPEPTRSFTHETNSVTDKGVYVGVEEEVDQESERENDGLDDIWTEMKMALECSKDVPVELSLHEKENDDMADCDHSFVLKDDIGYVCRICGVIDRGIDTIFEFQYKVKKSSRTYMSESRNAKYKDMDMDGVKLSEDDMRVTEICAHPRHMKQMKPHQLEGFYFLISNLVSENPGGCILAHAPGSGKTFMIISFMQSFLAKYPHARPLVVLPKGILATWKKEFKTWQVEDIPLLDFYSVKADNRSQQLVVLKKWVDNRSILFLGYKQFSTIVCDSGSSITSTSCQEILLKAPSILILDEGHTPRNENTDVLQSLAKVQTPRKVVLSGTLYQNHVKEVFNVLNLVRPKFTRSEICLPIIKRIMSKVDISGVRKHVKMGVNASFYDLVEHTLQKDKDFRRKVSVIHDLREMTSKVLHYYKGDFLDELPGLVDFTVVLNLGPKQKQEVKQLKKLPRKFKVSSVGSSIYLHPKLNLFPDISTTTDERMDEMLDNIDVKDGVKAKFFLTILNLCEAAAEKLLVFSPYLVPLKFLERLTMKAKGWSQGREIFVISGESTSDQREFSMDRFNNSPEAKVFFGSIKACGEGISLVGASRIIVLDVHLNPSVTRQAIGRAFRPGQNKKVFAYRLVAAESPEEEDHSTCFKKELISKMWFEWNEYCGYRDFEMETVDVKESGDLFLESSALSQDVKVLYKR